MLLEEIYTNQVHAADVTGCLQYYITIFNFFISFIFPYQTHNKFTKNIIIINLLNKYTSMLITVKFPSIQLLKIFMAIACGLVSLTIPINTFADAFHFHEYKIKAVGICRSIQHLQNICNSMPNEEQLCIYHDQ